MQQYSCAGSSVLFVTSASPSLSSSSLHLAIVCTLSFLMEPCALFMPVTQSLSRCASTPPPLPVGIVGTLQDSAFLFFQTPSLFLTHCLTLALMRLSK